MNSLVSIIIPTYNRAQLIGETLDSVLAQTYQNWECIVVDDGSTDNTDEVLALYMAKDARFRYYHKPKDRLPGGNAARNYGFEQSKGDYIQWFDSDDIMLPEFLEKKVAAFTSSAVFTICTGYSADAQLQNRKLKIMPIITNLYKQYVLWQSRIMAPSILFRRSFLKEKRLFDETLLRGQENDFFSRMFFGLKANQFATIACGLYYYRQHPDTKSSEDKNSYNSNYRKSLALVSLRNLKRGIDINDSQIINYHYRIVIQAIFTALHNKDYIVTRSLMKGLSKAIFKISPFYALFIWGTTNFFLISDRSIYRIEQFLKRKKFK